MAIKATVEKFGMSFPDAYHKINRLTYDSSDVQATVYAEPDIDEDGNPIPPAAETVWVKKSVINFEVITYASATTRGNYAEPVYRTYYSVDAVVDGNGMDLLAQAYEYLKSQPGYEDAVDC